MADEKYYTKYTCEKCGKKFEVEQGSRRKLCDDCLLEAVKKGK